jgi:radical SAM protein with 4Fe4S-binding SPASM domain
MNSSSISLETFRDVVEQTEPFYVTMNGLGEPLLDKTIFDKLELLHAKGIMSSMPTNGTYIRREKLDRLAEHLPDILQLSIDGATRESFEGIRKMGDFAKIVESYRAIAQRRADGQSRAGTSIRILCALQKKNLFDFREMFKLFKSLPGVTFSLVPVFQYDAVGAYFKDVVPDPVDVTRLRTEIDEATAAADTREEKDFYRSWRNAADGWMDTVPSAVPKTHCGSCTIPWYSTYIDAKGRVYPCCYLTETDHVMGNIHDRPFEQVWRGERYRDFRRRLAGDRANLEGCKTCPRNDDRLLKTLGRLRPAL